LSITPTVSICIPAYKQTLQLKKTLDSILVQDFQDFELLVSDDSPDNQVEELIAQYQFGDKLSYWRNLPAKGSPENWNEALKRARGKYVKLLHHDDWFTSPVSLRLFVEMLEEHPEADFAFSAANSWFEQGSRTELYSPGAHRIGHIRYDPLYLLTANVIGAPSALIVRRKAMELYDPKLIWLVDIENYIRMIHRNNKFVFTSDPLVTNTADLSGRISGVCIDNPEIEVKEHFYVYNKHKHILSSKLKHTHVLHLLKLLIRFGIKSIAEVRDCGYNGPLPARIRLYFTLNPISKSLSARTIFKLIDLQQRRGRVV
jgi:glycosyltransferase involved in cell wall biosynthesis